MPVGQVQEVGSAQWLDPPQVQHPTGQQQTQTPEDISPYQSVSQGLAPLMSREPHGHAGHNSRIINRYQCF